MQSQNYFVLIDNNVYIENDYFNICIVAAHMCCVQQCHYIDYQHQMFYVKMYVYCNMCIGVCGCVCVGMGGSKLYHSNSVSMISLIKKHWFPNMLCYDLLSNMHYRDQAVHVALGNFIFVIF